MTSRSNWLLACLVLAPLMAFAAEPYTADVRTTSYGISHIKANDWGSLGYGYGYTYANHNICVLAREVVAANGMESFYFGETDSRVQRDLFYTMVNNEDFIDTFLASISNEGRELVKGYAAGYSRYFNDTGLANLPADCRDEDWVRPITERDLLKVFYKLILRASAGQDLLLGAINDARPPSPGRSGVDDETISSLMERMKSVDLSEMRKLNRPFDLGSNMYALGANATQSGHGMVLGNPHFPWEGPLRWYEVHLTIPGVLNVMGASLHGVPLVNIGFNENVAWSHTVSPAWRFTLFELALNPGNPLQYLRDEVPVDMEAVPVSIQVDTGSGIETREHTFYRTEFGWVLDFPGQFGFNLWDTGLVVFALGDANEGNLRAIEQFLFMNLAGSLTEFTDILKDNVGLPWVHTVAADSDGNAFYGDMSVVPNVSAAKIADCPPPTFAGAQLAAAGLIVLDGSRTECDWDIDPDAPQPGIIGRTGLPSIQSQDYATNSNDNHWLANPDTPLEGFSPLFPTEQTTRSLRTRLGLVQVEERLAGTDGLGAPGYTLENLQDTLFGSRNLMAELIVDDLVAVCLAEGPMVDLNGAMIDVGPACTVLANWDDKRQNNESVGPHVLLEFLDAVSAATGSLDALFATPFDVDDPVYTPRDLKDTDPADRAALMQYLATGVQRLNDNGIAVNAIWGDIHFEEKNAVRYPIHGGRDGRGNFSIITTSLQNGVGYTPVVHGNSYMQTVTWDENGIVADALLSYSQSSDPENPNYADQTALYTNKQWVRLPFTEAEILADPDYSSFTLTGPRDSDNDSILDDMDNCIDVANPEQRDTDGDSIGNFCDPDVGAPNDCFVNLLDLSVYKANIFTAGDLDTDNNGDGETNLLDVSIIADFFFRAPGPSAAGCN